MKYVPLHDARNDIVFVNLDQPCWLVRHDAGTLIIFDSKSLEVRESPAEIRDLANL